MKPTTLAEWRKEEKRLADSRTYVTTFCNFPHRVGDGKPVEHECYVIAPKALAEEMSGVFGGPEWTKWSSGPRRTMRRGVKG